MDLLIKLLYPTAGLEVGVFWKKKKKFSFFFFFLVSIKLIECAYANRIWMPHYSLGLGT